MSAHLAFTCAALVTFGLRCGPVLLAGAAERSRIDEWIRFAAPAAMAAIVIGSLTVRNARIEAPGLADLTAVVVGALVARRTGNAAMALVAGLPAHWFAASVVAGF